MLQINTNTQFQISELISSSLIGNNSEEIERIYQQLYSYSVDQKNSIDLSNKYMLKEPYLSHVLAYNDSITTMAIDLPVFYKSSGNNKPTIMICAMDALPPKPDSHHWNNKDFNFKNDIGLWAPFSIIDDWKSPTGSMKSNIPFFAELLKNFNLYITDIYKLFFRYDYSNQLINSNQISNYTDLKNEYQENIHGYILSKEIEIIQPDCIVTLGNNSRNTLISINENQYFHKQSLYGWMDDLQSYYWNKSIPIISSPHISGAANGAKSKILNNEKYSEIKAKYQNERLAMIIAKKIGEAKSI